MMRVVGNKLMAVCGNCGKIVRADKPLFGSFHICTTDDEQRQYRDQIRQAVGWWSLSILSEQRWSLFKLMMVPFGGTCFDA